LSGIGRRKDADFGMCAWAWLLSLASMFGVLGFFFMKGWLSF
jgi:hypothetical protein